jgi:amino-acid N-acetyltransferase
MNLRPANVYDAKDIYELLKFYSDRGLLLLRTMSNIYDNIRDFKILETGSQIIGIAALHVCWEDLGEIRSICVKEEFLRKGYGKILSDACIEDADKLKLKKIFVLTYQIDFFKKQGFFIIDKKSLPHKVWAECVNCPKFPNCDEVAMMKEI